MHFRQKVNKLWPFFALWLFMTSYNLNRMNEIISWLNFHVTGYCLNFLCYSWSDWSQAVSWNLWELSSYTLVDQAVSGQTFKLPRRKYNKFICQLHTSVVPTAVNDPWTRFQLLSFTGKAIFTAAQVTSCLASKEAFFCKTVYLSMLRSHRSFDILVKAKSSNIFF